MSATRTLGVFLKRASQKTTAPRFLGTASEPLVKTALFDLHKELGGDMVPFAGYELPVLYKGENGGVMKEHLWCRSDGKASLFDVSHMGQVRFRVMFWPEYKRLDTRHLTIQMLLV